MATYDNPAARLHALLTEFARLAANDPNEKMPSVWAKVLGIRQDDFPAHIGTLLTLLDDVERAAEEADAPFEPMVDYVDGLRRSVWPKGGDYDVSAYSVNPNGNALQFLAVFGHTLAREDPDGPIPHDDDVNALRETVGALFDDVVNAEGLPPEVRRGLLQRLTDMLAALDLVKVGGPDSLRRAAESLAATAIQFEDAVKDSPDGRGLLQRSWATAKEVTMIVAAAAAIGADMPKAIDNGGKLFELGAGIEQKALPPGDAPPQQADTTP